MVQSESPRNFLYLTLKWVTKWRRRRDENQQLADEPRSGRPSKIVGIVKEKWNKLNTKEENQSGNAPKNLKALALI